VNTNRHSKLTVLSARTVTQHPTCLRRAAGQAELNAEMNIM